MGTQDGLGWVSGISDLAGISPLEPCWTREPDVAKIELIARKHFKLHSSAACTVKLYEHGYFNKLYMVETEASTSIMCVNLPVHPISKTNSEVATMNFVRQNTDIPVSQVLAFDDSSDNELGFEWILMERIPGRPLRSRWRKTPLHVKEALVKEIAKYQVQLFRQRFSAIGNLFLSSSSRSGPIEHAASQGTTEDSQNTKNSDILLVDGENLDEAFSTLKMNSQTPEGRNSTEEFSTMVVNTKAAPLVNKRTPVVGPLVSHFIFQCDHAPQDFPRGPFTTSEAWLRARLELALADQETIPKYSDEKDDIKDAHSTREVIERLLRLLPSIFPPLSRESGQSVLFHGDLSFQNILVDGNGKLTGIVDWDFISAVPLWKACQLPYFLQGRPRDDEPDIDNLTALTIKSLNTYRWLLEEYELTKLKATFLEEMKRLEPAWIREFEESSLEADFELAVQTCDNRRQFNRRQFKLVQVWLDKREKSNIEPAGRLCEILHGYRRMDILFPA